MDYAARAFGSISLLALTSVLACGGKEGTGPVPVAEVAIMGTNVALAPGATQQLTVTTTDAAGNSLSERVVSWTTSNATVATVHSSTGLVTAVADGSAIITATSEGVTDQVTVTVTTPVASIIVSPPDASLAPGATQSFTAVTKDAAGNTLIGRTITWSSSPAGIVSVNTSTGLVTALADGIATITASSEGVTGSASVTVTTPVASVSVSPPGASMAPGVTQQFSAIVKDVGGNALDGRVVTWSSSDLAVVEINANTGLATAVSDGNAEIRATSEGILGTATVVVTTPVATVTVTPASVRLVPEMIQQLSATTRGAAGNVLTGRTVAWSSSNTAVATVDPSTGAVTAVAAGTATITATSEGQTGTAGITVEALRPGTVTAGDLHTCALTSSGAAYCWGYNEWGQLGDGTTTERLTPVAVAGGLTFREIHAGSKHTIALTTTGAAYGWGDNNSAQIGDGTAGGIRREPTAVAGGYTFSTLSTGQSHTIALTSAGVAYAWGPNLRGELGDGTPTLARYSPVAVAGGHTFSAVAAGNDYSVALTTAGKAYAWGFNIDGRLGDGTMTDRRSPVPVSGNRTFSAITAGAATTFALESSGAAFGWGPNSGGQIGDGTQTDRLSPVAVAGGLTFHSISAFAHTVGIAKDGRAYAWGDNYWGELGDGTTTMRLTPTPVAGSLIFTSIAAGPNHTVGVTSTGAAYAWGYNAYGQLGDGTRTNRLTPTPVAGGLIFR